MVPLPEPVVGYRSRVFSQVAGKTTVAAAVAVTPAGEEVARATVTLEVIGDARATLTGDVATRHRRQGLGSALFRWGEAVAREHFRDALAQGQPLTLRVDLDSTPDELLLRFLTRHGLTLAVAEDEMRRPTDLPPATTLPPGMSITCWTEEAAPRFHEVYVDAFAARPGFPGWDLPMWRAHYVDSPHFRPDLSLLLSDADRPVAYAVCSVEDGVGWIIQMGVRPGARRRGAGEAILRSVISRFRDDGIAEAALEVATNNPEARALYEKLGFAATLSYQSYRKLLR